MSSYLPPIPAASVITDDDGVYGSRPIKRQRRTNMQLAKLKLQLRQIAEEIRPATVRQVFYQMVSRGRIGKTEEGYKLVVRLLTAMRRDKLLPFHWIADNTRWMRKPSTHDGLEDLLNETAQLYRRSVWNSQDAYVEIWLEKDALSGVIYDVTSEYDVPLMVTRGYPSITFLHSAASAIAEVGKPAHLYYLGDNDPSGLDIPRKVEAGIREFAPKAEVHFERVAVTAEQIERWELPTRPTKKSDTRAKAFEGGSVELDAIPPDELRGLVRRCIEKHIDRQALNVLQKAEDSERAWLTELAERFAGGIQ